MKARLALVGLGTWAAQGHLPVYQGPRLASYLEVAGLCSRDLSRAKAWCQRFGVAKGYDDFAAMLAEIQPNLVAVTTPDHAHTEYVVMALEAGAHVLVEKPLALSWDDCQRIDQAAKSSHRQVLTLFHKRSDPLWAEARQRILAGQYGHLQMALASIQNPLAVPAGGYFSSELAAQSSPNWFLGTHFYDLLRYMTGCDPVEVRAYGHRKVLPEHGVDTLDSVKADVLFQRPGQHEVASISLMLSWNLPDPSTSLTKQAMQLHFERGELELDGTRRGFAEFGVGQYRDVNPYFMRSTDQGLQGYGASYLEDAIYSLLMDDYRPSVPLADLADAWWATALASAVDQSLANGGRSVTVQRPGEVVG